MEEQMWYYAIGGQQQGPVPFSTLEGLLRAGRIDRDTLVWTSGMAGWTRAAEVPDLQVRPMEPPPISNYRGGRDFPGAVSYAGFWKRYWAYCIDQTILSIAFLGVVYFLFARNTISLRDPMAGESMEIAVALTFCCYGAAWLYYTVKESSPLQATLGKLALGIRVTDLQGNRLSFWRAVSASSRSGSPTRPSRSAISWPASRRRSRRCMTWSREPSWS